MRLRWATPADAQPIQALVRSERLNPNGIHWRYFVVACGAQGIVGAVQLRQHADGARELGSLVVAPSARGCGVATRLIDTLLAAHHGPVQMVTGGAYADHYRRWGFHRIAPAQAPRSVRRNYRLGRLARVISFFRGQPPKRLVILHRASQPAALKPFVPSGSVPSASMPSATTPTGPRPR